MTDTDSTKTRLAELLIKRIKVLDAECMAMMVLAQGQPDEDIELRGSAVIELLYLAQHLQIELPAELLASRELKPDAESQRYPLTLFYEQLQTMGMLDSDGNFSPPPRGGE